MGTVVLHFEEEQQAILSLSVQAESGDLVADTILKITMVATEENDRKSEEEDIFSLCSLQIELLGLFFPGTVNGTCRNR